MPTEFYEWDYENDRVVLWQRHGECNHCGQCCMLAGGIEFKVTDTSEVGPGMYPEDFNPQNGGDSPGVVGKWSEFQNRDGERFYFGDIAFFPKPSPKPCPCWKNSRCSIYEERPEICRVWPTNPTQIIPFDECSFSFEKVAEWRISELDDVQITLQTDH